MSFAVRLMEAWAFGIIPNQWYNLDIHWGNYTVPKVTQNVLGSLCLIGFMLFDLIYTAVVVAYVSQCELVRKVVDDRSKNIQHQRRGQIGLSPQETIQVHTCIGINVMSLTCPVIINHFILYCMFSNCTKYVRTVGECMSVSVNMFSKYYCFVGNTQNIGKIRTYMEYINGRVSWLVSVVLLSFASGTATSKSIWQ